MRTWYLHRLEQAQAFANFLCAKFDSGSAASVRPTSPFDGWYVVELQRPTAERMTTAHDAWLQWQAWDVVASER